MKIVIAPDSYKESLSALDSYKESLSALDVATR